MKIVTWTGLLAVSAALAACIFNAKYTIGGTVTGLRGSGLVLENNSGNDLSVTANGSFTFGSGVVNDDAYAVTVKTQPSNPAQTCSVSNGAGAVDKADITNVLVNCTQAGRFAYVANQTANTISAYSIAASGALTGIGGSPFISDGTTPSAVAVDPNGTFLYVANNGSNDVSVYAIADDTGILTSAGVGFPAGNGPIAVTVDPTDRYLYVANLADNTVSAFAIQSGGLATAISGSPFAVGAEPISLRTDPTGRYLYVANYADGTVTVFAIDSTTGALTEIAGSPFGAGVGADSVVIDPTGRYAYVANETAATISEYSINSSTGGLSAVPGSPLATGSSPESVAVNPQGSLLYAANVTSKNAVAAYGIAPSNGALTLATTASAGTFPLSIAVDPLGQFVYVANENSASVSVYSANATTGALTPVAGSPFAAQSGARSIAID